MDVVGWLDKRQSLPKILLSALPEIYGILRPIYCHFGYRTLKAMTEYIQTGLVLNVDVKQLIDEVVLSKVFPKIKGDRTVLTTEVFDQLEAWCEMYEMSLCLEKTIRLRAQVQHVGMVRYWH